MDIYLDIDGVLIYDGLYDLGKPAPYLKEFLQALNESGYKISWLTTHCTDGDLGHLRQYLQFYLPKDVYVLTTKYKPTVWGEYKTDAIDFYQDFLWLDDDASLQEQEVLRTHGVEHNLIKIDLRKNKNQLKDIISSGVFNKSENRL